MMASKELEAVFVRMPSGKRIPVTVDTRVGEYALHHMVIDHLPREGGWTVTHVASGFAVWTTLHRDDAMTLATWLDTQRVLPQDLHTWRASLDAVQTMRFVSECESRAPRLRPSRLLELPPGAN